jgi:hypothetical protein
MLRALVTTIFLLSLLLAFALAVMRLLGFRAPVWLTRAVSIGAFPVLLAHVLASYTSPEEPSLGDYQIMWSGGRDLLARQNPYKDIHGSNAFLYPPTTFTLFAALGKLSFQSSVLVWRCLNAVLAVALVGLARKTYNSLVDRTADEVSREEAAEISAALVLSLNVAVCLKSCQLGIFIALMANLAILLLAQRRPLLAGLALLGVSIKPQTLLPVLILFANRRALPTWGVLVAGTLFSTLLFFTPDRWPELAELWIRRLREVSATGSVNDFSSANPNNGSILSFGVALDGLGLHDRGTVGLVTAILVGSMGLALILEVTVWRRLPRTAHVSLVFCYAMLFVYHRGNHDCVAMAFPLVHALALTRGREGQPVWSARLAGCGILLTFQMTHTTQKVLARSSWLFGRPGWLIRALVIPRSVYLLSLLFRV